MKNTNYQFKLFLILLITFISTIDFINAQETDYKKNAIYINYGNVIFISQASISYERTVFQKEHLRTKLKLNYGKHLGNHLDLETDAKVIDNYKSISGVLLYQLFEINLGLAFTKYTLEKGPSADPNKDYDITYNGTELYGSAGIRYEKDGFLMRAGIGNLELLYAGIGFTF